VIVYPNAYHDFDSARPPAVSRALVSGRNCDMRVDLDRFTVSLRATGEDITATSAAYARGCLTRGATVGGDAEARRRAPEDVTVFLEKAFAR
jgi:hypothetical protein